MGSSGAGGWALDGLASALIQREGRSWKAVLPRPSPAPEAGPRRGGRPLSAGVLPWRPVVRTQHFHCPRGPRSVPGLELRFSEPKPPGMSWRERPLGRKLTYLRKGGFANPFALFCGKEKEDVYGRLKKSGSFQ